MNIGFALCGSFCTYSKIFPIMEALANEHTVIPIFSDNAYCTDSRFGTAAYWRKRIAEAADTDEIIDSITAAEPIGPKKLIDALVIAPCTGNTLGKLANGIYDGCVPLAAKANLRNNRPVIIAPSTNDGLSASAKNIGTLLNTKNIFFVPFGQDDPFDKNNSLVAKWEYLLPAVESALEGKQLQPIIM